jgi:hypothetical protein
METATVSKVLRLFNKLSKPEQLEIADKIGEQTFKERLKQMSKSARGVDMADDDIIPETHTVRNSNERFGLL